MDWNDFFCNQFTYLTNQAMELNAYGLQKHMQYRQSLNGSHRLRLCKAVIKKFIVNSSKHELYHAHNVKMSKIVGILTFISMINITSECLKAIKNVFLYFSLNVQL